MSDVKAPEESAQTSTGSPTMLGIWKVNRSFRYLTISQVTSMVGTQVTVIGLPFVLIDHLHPGAMIFGLVAASRYLPFLLLGSVVGLLVDRYDHKRLMIISDVVRFCVVGAIPVLVWAQWLNSVGIVCLIFVVATCRVVFDLAFSAYIVRAFEKRELLAASSAFSAAGSIGELAGPALAAVLIAGLGSLGTLVFDATTFAISAVALLGIARVASAETDGEADGQTGGFRGGLAVFKRSPMLRNLLWGTAMQNLALMAFQSIAVLYLVRAEHLTDGITPIVLGMIGLGGLIGALLTRRLVQRLSPSRMLIFVPVVIAASIGLLAVPGGDAGIVKNGIGCFIMGIGFSAGNIVVSRYRQSLIPAAAFGRVSGIYSSVLMGALPVGALIGGVISEIWGTREAVTIASLAAAAALIFFALATRAARIEVDDADTFA